MRKRPLCPNCERSSSTFRSLSPLLLAKASCLLAAGRNCVCKSRRRQQLLRRLAAGTLQLHGTVAASQRLLPHWWDCLPAELPAHLLLNCSWGVRCFLRQVRGWALFPKTALARATRTQSPGQLQSTRRRRCRRRLPPARCPRTRPRRARLLLRRTPSSRSATCVSVLLLQRLRCSRAHVPSHDSSTNGPLAESDPWSSGREPSTALSSSILPTSPRVCCVWFA